MPIYEYSCRDCRKTFDKLVRTMDRRDAPVVCPECGSKQTERTLSTFAVGAESARSTPLPAGGCGRCGGPGPCAMDR